MKVVLSALALLVVFTPMSLVASRSQKAHGATVYKESGCSHCHTIRKAGGNKGPDLSGVGRRLNDAQMRRQIVEGSKIMPPFRDVLDSTDLTDLLAYLHSCRDKARK
jgi:mono/diheme cytochrome c family protein